MAASMIRIINTGKTAGDDEYGYSLYINNEFIAKFTHARKEGLAECLVQAASAVEAEEQKRLAYIAELAAAE